MFAACPMPWVLGMCFGRSWRAQCYGRVKKNEVFCQKCCIHMGVPWGTPRAGWFISWKIRSIWCILMYTVYTAVYIPRYTKTWGGKTVTILCWSQDGVCVCACAMCHVLGHLRWPRCWSRAMRNGRGFVGIKQKWPVEICQRKLLVICQCVQPVEDSGNLAPAETGSKETGPAET